MFLRMATYHKNTETQSEIAVDDQHNIYHSDKITEKFDEITDIFDEITENLVKLQKLRILKVITMLIHKIHKLVIPVAN